MVRRAAGSAEEARGLEALEVLDGLDAELEGGVLVAGESREEWRLHGKRSRFFFLDFSQSNEFLGLERVGQRI